jgi:hypothetical protein
MRQPRAQFVAVGLSLVVFLLVFQLND